MYKDKITFDVSICCIPLCPSRPGCPGIPINPGGPIAPRSPFSPCCPGRPSKPGLPGSPFWPGKPGKPVKANSIRIFCITVRHKNYTIITKDMTRFDPLPFRAETKHIVSISTDWHSRWMTSKITVRDATDASRAEKNAFIKTVTSTSFSPLHPCTSPTLTLNDIKDHVKRRNRCISCGKKCIYKNSNFH